MLNPLGGRWKKLQGDREALRRKRTWTAAGVAVAALTLGSFLRSALFGTAAPGAWAAESFAFVTRGQMLLPPLVASENSATQLAGRTRSRTPDVGRKRCLSGGLLAARAKAKGQSKGKAKARGFGGKDADAGGETSSGGTVTPPAGGWPSLSVVLLSRSGKVAGQRALESLAAQDYPQELIREVLVLGAEELSAGAPEALRPLLKEFKEPQPPQEGEGEGGGQQVEGSKVGIAAQLQACSGDVVAFWGDDHVSSALRLRRQVAAVVSEGEVASLLQPSWFFDPETGDFLQVQQWPVSELEEVVDEEAALPAGFSELMVCADELSLCSRRETLLQASSGLAPGRQPAEELKELLLRLLQKRKPQLLPESAVTWAALRTPPAAVTYGTATPPAALQRLLEVSGGQGRRGKGKEGRPNALVALAERLQLQELKPAGAVELLLEEAQQLTAAPNPAVLERVRKALASSLEEASPQETAAGISEMLSWPGLAAGQGNARAAQALPLFFACFRAFRSHVAESVDLYDMRDLADISEGLVRLASSMWATDARVNEALAMLIARDLHETGSLSASLVWEDFVGTLGLRDTLNAMSYAAREMPGETFPVDVMTKLAWAMSTGRIENAALQNKVARCIMSQAEKLMPSDIGKLWIVMHEHRWFKDDTTIRYLLETLVSRVQTLKKEDPGLANMLAAAA